MCAVSGGGGDTTKEIETTTRAKWWKNWKWLNCFVQTQIYQSTEKAEDKRRKRILTTVFEYMYIFHDPRSLVRYNLFVHSFSMCGVPASVWVSRFRKAASSSAFRVCVCVCECQTLNRSAVLLSRADTIANSANGDDRNSTKRASM